MLLLCLALVTYSLCFLAADARIFGADAAAWNAVIEDPAASSQDRLWLQELGVFRIRQRLLRLRVVREHLSCYFCMGIWAGPVAHFLLWQLQHNYVDGPSSYVLQHHDTLGGWGLGLLCAFLIGASSSFLINAAALSWADHTGG